MKRSAVCKTPFTCWTEIKSLWPSFGGRQIGRVVNSHADSHRQVFRKARMGFRFDPVSVVRSYVRLALNRWVISGEVLTGIEIRQKFGGMGRGVGVGDYT